MSLAVVILSYNHPELTAKCVSSCLKKYKAEDILLVHNGSLEKHKDKLTKSFPLVQHLTLKKNKGFAGGANFGLRSAFRKYEWVFFITNDCELLELGKLPSLTGLYAPQIMKRNTNQVDSLGGFVTAKQGLLKHNKSASDFNYVPGTAFLLHKQVFESGFAFDERLHTYWEDVNLSLELKGSEFKLGLAGDFILKHKIGKTCHKDKFYTSYLFQRNKGIVCRRHCRGTDLLLFECRFVSDISVRICKLLIHKKWQQALLLCKAYWDSWLSYSTTLSAADTAS